MGTIGSVIPAGGWGCVVRGQTKLVEFIDGEPIVRKPVDLLRSKLGLSPTLVVINETYGQQVMEATRECDVTYVHQLTRSGTAGAVKECLPELIRSGCEDIVVIYGDMPCFKPDSIQKLLAKHLAGRNVLSMFQIDLQGEYGQYVESFGRILYDSDNRMIGIREPYEMTREELKRARYVNPSAWCFNVAFLVDNISRLQPHDKGDGFPPEFWLPDFVPMAVEQGQPVCQVDLPDAREAFGVNTARELELASRYVAESLSYK